MNVLVPPFDDVHVRRAVNLVLDREAIVRALGGPQRGPIATSIFPPALEGPPMRSGPPLPVTGDLEAAQHEMSLSRYDSNSDGRCDAKLCRKVLFVKPTIPPEVNAIPLIVEALDSIGIHLFSRELDTATAYTTIQTVKNLVPISLQRAVAAWYPDPAAIAHALHSSGISCVAQVNFSEVGFTKRLASECGVLKSYLAVRANIPTVDGRIDACQALGGAARSTCWADFDSYVMANIVPWGPLRFPRALIATGRTLTRFEYDQAFGTISLCHIAVAAA
jgi:ABC-type transport system substrate-binding protein